MTEQTNQIVMVDMSSIGFPLNESICIPWYFLPIFYTPFVVMISLREYFAHIFHKYDRLHNEFITFDVQYQIPIPPNSLNIDQQDQSAPLIISHNSLQTAPDKRNQSRKLISIKREAIDAFDKRVANILWYCFERSYYIQINQELSISLSQIILNYSHSDTEKAKIEVGRKYGKRLRFWKKVSYFFNFVFELFIIVSLLIHLISFIIYCLKFGVYDIKTSKSEANGFTRFLIFNSMLLFHPCMKYVSYFNVWIASHFISKILDNLLPKLLFAKFYQRQLYVIFVGFCYLVGGIHLLSTFLPVYLVATILFVWPYLIFLMVYFIIFAVAVHIAETVLKSSGVIVIVIKS